jgi:hypothetical protein
MNTTVIMTVIEEVFAPVGDPGGYISGRKAATVLAWVGGAIILYVLQTVSLD